MPEAFGLRPTLDHVKESLIARGGNGGIKFEIEHPITAGEGIVTDGQLWMGRIDISVIPRKSVDLKKLGDFAKKLLPQRYQIGFQSGGEQPSYFNTQGWRLPRYMFIEYGSSSQGHLPEEGFRQIMQDVTIMVFPDTEIFDLLKAYSARPNDKRLGRPLDVLEPLTWGVVHQSVIDRWKLSRKGRLGASLIESYFPGTSPELWSGNS